MTAQNIIKNKKSKKNMLAEFNFPTNPVYTEFCVRWKSLDQLEPS